jgi:protein-disulfide isomerase
VAGPKKRREAQASQPTPKQQQQKQLQKITTYTGIAVVVIVATIVGYYLFANRPPANQSPETVEFQLERQPSLGDPQAPVKVVEFGDFKCTACKYFEDEVFPQLKEEYIDMGRIEFYFINFPLPIGNDSYTAAYAAECVYRQSEAAFWAYYRAVYQNQGPESITWATPEFLLNVIQEHVQGSAGVDVAEIAQCIAENRYARDVEEDRESGRRAGVTATPTFFVNGQKVVGAAYAPLKQAIERELDR